MTSDFHVPSNWYESFFTGPANRFWEAMVPPAMTLADAAFATRHLDVGAGARLLDVPCGAGRHALQLARSGYEVTGVDISKDAIARAAQAAAEEGLQAAFVQADMLHFRADEPFDGAVCLGNSIGYFEPDQTLSFLRRLASNLRPRARFVLDTSICAESALPIQQQGRYVFEGGCYEAERGYDPQRSLLKTRATLTLDGVSHELAYQHHVITSGELVRLLAVAGLTTLGLYADADDAPFVAGSPRLLLVASRA